MYYLSSRQQTNTVNTVSVSNTDFYVKRHFCRNLLKIPELSFLGSLLIFLKKMSVAKISPKKKNFVIM